MNYFTLNQFAPYIDDFFFIGSDKSIYGTLVVCNPQNALIRSPGILHSKKSLRDHIQFIKEHQIKKVMAVGEDISFLSECPCIEELSVYPSVDAKDFDFSPIYTLPNLKSLSCQTMYGPKEQYVSFVDYSKFRNLETVYISHPKGHMNLGSLNGLKSLSLSGKQPTGKTLKKAFIGRCLEFLDLSESLIDSLDGIEECVLLKSLSISFCRNLESIDHLIYLKDTLQELRIDTCGKIQDFSVLSHLSNLEVLTLQGSNIIPNLGFIQCMPNLRVFKCFMTVEDGDLSMCLHIPYANFRNHKHYNYKDKDFSKVL